MHTSLSTEQKQLLQDIRKEVLSIFPEGNAHYGSYISLRQIKEVLDPLFKDWGVVMYQQPNWLQTDDTGLMPHLNTTIAKVDSDVELFSSIPLIHKPNDPQSYGSSLTYMRRYALLTMLDIVSAETDDDGESDVDVPVTKMMPENKLIELGQLLASKGITTKADKVTIIQTIAGTKSLNTSAVNRLFKAVNEATPDTLQEIVLKEDII